MSGLVLKGAGESVWRRLVLIERDLGREILRVGDRPMAWGVRRRPRDRPEPPALEAGGLLSTN